MYELTIHLKPSTGMALISCQQTMVVVDTYAVNMREEFWGADARDYRPDRFLELKGKPVSILVYSIKTNIYIIWRPGTSGGGMGLGRVSAWESTSLITCCEHYFSTW